MKKKETQDLLQKCTILNDEILRSTIYKLLISKKKEVYCDHKWKLCIPILYKNSAYLFILKGNVVHDYDATDFYYENPDFKACFDSISKHPFGLIKYYSKNKVSLTEVQ